MNEQASLHAAIHEEVKLVDHDPSWAGAFAIEKDRLLGLLPGIFLDIQHIGSTAVPGLPAKPIIDILVGVLPMENLDAVQNPA